MRRTFSIVLLWTLLALAASPAAGCDPRGTPVAVTPVPETATSTPRPARAPVVSPTTTPAPADAPILVTDVGRLPGTLRDALRSFGTLEEAGAIEDALVAVESGAAAFAVLRLEPGEDPGAAPVLLEEPLALYVPFTLRIEDLRTDDALALLDLAVQDWSEVGGPSVPAVPLLTEGGTLSTPGDHFAGPGEPGAYTVAPWTGPVRGAKALRIDGLAPGDEGYPLAHRWVVVGAAPEVAEALAQPAPPPGYITLAVVGDIMLARSVGQGIESEGPGYPFVESAGLLEADLLFGNVECVLSGLGSAAPKGFTFRADPASAAGLAAAGFDVISLANNHAMDFGPEALLDTIEVLGEAGIATAGAGADAAAAARPVTLEVDGIAVAFLAYGAFFDEPDYGRDEQEAGARRPGIAWGDPAVVAADVAAAREMADVVVVSMHAGFEYSGEVIDTQRELARTAIDAGADLVVGSGPHVLQGIEYYGDGVIAYSLGNWVFDFDEQDYAVPGLPSGLTGVLVFALDEAGVRGFEFRPAIIEQDRPAPARGADAERVYDWFYPLAESLAH